LRHGYKLGQKQPFFFKLVKDLAAEMGAAYPELARDTVRVEGVLKQEEERFGETLENGMKILEAALHREDRMLDGETVFALYDTFGFPVDLTADIARERGVTLDMAGFEAAMSRQREQARAAGKFRASAGVEYSGGKTRFTGYDRLAGEGRVSALYVDGASVPAISSGQQAIVVLDTTPFYAESGGQVGDKGEFVAAGGTFEVADTQKIQAEVFGHHGRLKTGTLKVGDKVEAKVDSALRARTMRNHSVTHLMHKALRETLGPHVQQKGSLVDADKTRFDFAHDKPMSDAQIREVEKKVNAEILRNEATAARIMKFDDAVKGGAMALFGEKYGDEVRVLDIGSSRELCGGTHVERTGDIGFFKITSQGGVAAGVRRVEATTGEGALAYVQGLDGQLAEAAGALKAQPQEIGAKIAQMQDHARTLEKELARLKSRLASSQGDDLAGQALDVKGVKVLSAALDGADAKALRETLDKLKASLKSAAVVLGSSENGRVTLIAGVTDDLTAKLKAGELVNFVAQQVGGKGGGRADMAQAGGNDASKLSSALDSVKAWVEQRL
jgi:alanyl-tRNA synthetase